MIFASQQFIFLFAPIAYLAYWLLPYRFRMHWLLVASYFFYGWWDWRFCFLMLFSTLVDYLVGMWIPRASTHGRQRLLMLLSIAVNIGLLGFFKYAGFFGRSVNAVLAYFQAGGEFPVLDIALPIGISFYTFQSLSYTMDIYRGEVKPTKSFLHFAAFVSLFPQLVAGPVVRFSQLDSQLKNLPLRLSSSHLNLGLVFFSVGLVKKTLIADRVAYFNSQLWADFAHLSPGEAWIAVLGSAVQWYFDFAGYSLMAVGLGYLLGMRLPQNFNSPYRADDISDFWHKWHISLSSWLKDYLYIFLGGRKAHWRWFALIGTMFLGGLWHGAAWTFVIFGLLHGFFLLMHHGLRYLGIKWRGGWCGRIGTMLLFALSLVVFVSPDMPSALRMYAHLVDFGSYLDPVHNVVLYYLLLATGLLWAICLPNLYSWVEEQRGQPRPWALAALGCLAALAVLFLSDTSPFLYYQF